MKYAERLAQSKEQKGASENEFAVKTAELSVDGAILAAQKAVSNANAYVEQELSKKVFNLVGIKAALQDKKAAEDELALLTTLKADLF
jgi:hypothetical protein